MFFNIQMAVLFFANIYVETVMLSNLASVEDLSGNAGEYLSAVVVVLLFSFLPIRSIGHSETNTPGTSLLKWQTKWQVLKYPIFLAAVILEIALLMTTNVTYSPFGNYVILLRQEYRIYQMRLQIADSNSESAAETFYSTGLTDYREKDSSLAATPNIILIFTEGLSQNIIDDEREIMPNVASLEEESLNFTEYYNHTFATYRGLIGQLYSGYQMDNLDENNLISLQSILSDQGYHTVFINTEPNNEDFSDYLASMGFDEIIGETTDTLSGTADTYSDKEAYKLLWDEAEELSAAEEPFFLVIYTFGTHASFDSQDEIFEDGSDSELNKFYNADYQFGEFFEKFKKSDLANNTILIFTADHAAYQDSKFTSAFPDYKRFSSQLDEIPLAIYYQGIKAETISVNGRNSLCLAPTILDLLDISAPNYFLGTSLFADSSEDVSFDTVFYSENNPVSTVNGIISSLSESDETWFDENLRLYFTAKLSSPSESYLESVNSLTVRTTTSLSSDGTLLEITYTPAEDENYEQYWFPVWSAEDGQDDIVWYVAKKKWNGSWHATVTLSDHTLHGELNIHVYGGETEAEECLEVSSIVLP
ncbi:MAG: sulfatase-like hydrolase/transferase [Lachnospiraceae bacterium]|nr:sulfatase-like hydrolase/transferase [Lachnospiraceae bacterium]